MKAKLFVSIFIITLIVFCSGANSINVRTEKLNILENEIIKTTESSPGSWHEEEIILEKGKDFTDIYKIGGNEGYWEAPFDTDAVKMVADHNRIRAVWDLAVNDGPVNSVKYDIKYKDLSVFSDGPDVLIYKWDDTWDSYSNIAGYGETEFDYVWHSHTFNENPDKYVNSNGLIRIAAQAFDDDSWLQQDKISVKRVKITYQTADEAIYNVDYEAFDDDADGSNDTVNISLDADVGNYGDGTTVDVTANCQLINPNDQIVDSETITWTIVDHQVEPVYLNLSSLGSINGQYTINISLIDEYGNEEDSTTHSLYLEPDPQRTIQFFTSEGGDILFNDTYFFNGESTIVSDGIYEIQAAPYDYYAFSHWESSEGVNVSTENIKEANTTVTVSGDGNLTAYYVFSLYTVMFYIDPEVGGVIQMGGYEFYNGTGCYVEDGEYEIIAVANEPNYYFDHWESTEGAVFDDVTSATTIVNFTYDAYILAVFTENLPPDTPQKPDGPNAGEINTELEFSTKSTDPNGNNIYYKWDWGDGTYSEWMGPFESDEQITATHSFAGARDYEIKVQAKDETGVLSDWSTPLIVSISSKPTAPQISGPSNGKINNDYEFTFVSTDLDGDSLYYYIEWGDGDVEDWIGPYESGELVTLTHKWTEKKSFTIKAMTKDENNVVSDFSTFAITLPREKEFKFLKLFENYPIISNLLKLIINLI